MGRVSAGPRERQQHTFQAVCIADIKGPVVTLALGTNPVEKVSCKVSAFHFPSTLILHQEEKKKHSSTFTQVTSLPIEGD